MINLVIAVLLGMVITCCTLEKTDYEAELASQLPEESVFEEALTIEHQAYSINLETLGGKFYNGFNEIHFIITNTVTNEEKKNAEVKMIPIRNDGNGEAKSCPHSDVISFDGVNEYYTGYAVFDVVSDANNNWEIYLEITLDGASFIVQSAIEIAEQPNKNLNMTSFTGNDGALYYIALIAPANPRVAENELTAGFFRYNEPEAEAGVFPDASQFSYTTVTGATLELDPRMPEPNMGNHSSPNNEDLKQGEDGWYHGVVNYTMTGNWTLNFIFRNAEGEVIKGTEVPTDFTPGVQGAKSELHIDTLF